MDKLRYVFAEWLREQLPDETTKQDALLKTICETLRADAVELIFAATGGNASTVARLLGCDRGTVAKYLKERNLTRQQTGTIGQFTYKNEPKFLLKLKERMKHENENQTDDDGSDFC